MPLTHTRDLFAKALKGKYALGAFNVNNMELLQAIVEACEAEKAPVILQISKGARSYANPIYLKKLIEAAISLSNIPIAVHLDHGDSFELCKDCIDEGFTSVMIDASHEPLEKNIEVCRRVVEYAHKHNGVVEGELGQLVGAQFDEGEAGGGYSQQGHYTHPQQAVDFVRQSGVDSLAVAIGNSHGAYKFKGEQHLDLERLKAIKKALMDAGMGDYPLVLHGASSVPKGLVEETSVTAWAGAARRWTGKPSAASAASAASVTTASAPALAATEARCSLARSGGHRTIRRARPSSSTSAWAAPIWARVRTSTERPARPARAAPRPEPWARALSARLTRGPNRRASARAERARRVRKGAI